MHSDIEALVCVWAVCGFVGFLILCKHNRVWNLKRISSAADAFGITLACSGVMLMSLILGPIFTTCAIARCGNQ